MKTDKSVIDALQAALNAEADLENVYFLNGNCLWEDLAIKTADELLRLGKQCRKFKKMLVSYLKVRAEDKPEISVGAAAVGDSVTNILADLIKLENAIVEQYTDAILTAWNMKDMSVFHFLQHLWRAHTDGWNGYIGHLHYLEHEQKQLTKLGENDYIAAHIA